MSADVKPVEVLMASREKLLTHLWETAINSNLMPKGLDNVVAHCKRRPNDPFGDSGAAIERLLAAGASKADICLLQRAAAYEAVFATLEALEDPGVDDDDFGGLHEDLLTADPTELEGRPGSAEKWLSAHQGF